MNNQDSKPTRLQRKRTAGSSLSDACKNPNGYKIVDRTTIYGNPFVVTMYSSGWGVGHLRRFDTESYTGWIWYGSGPIYFETQKAALEFSLSMFRAWAWLMIDRGDVDLEELRGKDLVCFCGLDAPCHADIWLELANDDIGGER